MSQTTIDISAVEHIWNKNTTSPLTEFARSIHPISDELAAFIDTHTFEHKVKKGTYLLRTKETCKYMFLVQKGAFRGYIKDGKKELTTWINTEGSMVTSIRGFHLQLPSFENIQAIEDCELIGASYEDLKYAYDHFIEMNTVGRRLLELYYISAEERAYIGRITNARSKYNYFIKNHNELINRIPLKYIASYLGITIETLSRIRRKLARPY